MTDLEKRAARMKWNPAPPGSKERDKWPSHVFLSPSTRTFPYKIEIDGEWVISEKALRSAISVANFRGNSIISARASKLLENLLSDDVQHDSLQHFGVLGMRWGVRKKYEPSPRSSSGIQAKTKGVSIKADGSITVQKGVSMQRLVRSQSGSRPLKDITYASLTDYDNAKYINFIGGKGFFGGGRDQVLTLTAKEEIKAPSFSEAIKITSDLFLNDSTFRNSFTNIVGAKISDRELEKIRKNPGGEKAEEWYTQVNSSLTFGAEFDPASPYIQKTIRESFKKNGFNAVRDENDFQSGTAKAPIIIFSPEKTLSVTRVSDITDELRKSSKAKLKEYNSLGRNWVNERLYD